MPVGWLDAVTDTTIWGRVSGEEAFGPVGLRVEVDGQLQGFGRAVALRHPPRPAPRAAGQRVRGRGGAGAAAARGVTPGGPGGHGAARRAGGGHGTPGDRLGGRRRQRRPDHRRPGRRRPLLAARHRRPGAARPGGAGGGAARVRHPHALEPGQQVEAWAFGVRSDGSHDQRQVLLPGSPLTTPEGATLEQPPATATSARLRPARLGCGPTAGPRRPTRWSRSASWAGRSWRARWCCRPRRPGPARPPLPPSSAATSTGPRPSTAATPARPLGPPPTGGC